MKPEFQIDPGVGGRIRAARERRGWTGTALAKKARLHSKSYVSAVEGGWQMPSVPALLRLANALELSTDWILFGRKPGRMKLADRCHDVARDGDFTI